MGQQLSPDTDLGVADLAISRRRIWVRTSQKNRYLAPVIKDTGWDLVMYDGFGEGYEPGADNFEQRADNKTSVLRYTGIHWLDGDDSTGDLLLRSSGRGCFTP